MDMNVQMIIAYIVGLVLFFILMSVLAKKRGESGAKSLAKVRVPIKNGRQRYIGPDDKGGENAKGVIPWDWIIAAIITVYFVTVLAVAR
jgi:ABC-type antimicrobial peptide transport system permease subunit